MWIYVLVALMAVAVVVAVQVSQYEKRPLDTWSSGETMLA